MPFKKVRSIGKQFRTRFSLTLSLSTFIMHFQTTFPLKFFFFLGGQYLFATVKQKQQKSKAIICLLKIFKN